MARLDIVPLISFLGENEDGEDQARNFLQWCINAKPHLFESEPLLAIYINEHYTMPWLGQNYALVTFDEALSHFRRCDDAERAHLLELFHEIADLTIIFMGEGPFTTREWEERIQTYKNNLNC